jgi:hypothetical protein
MGHHPGLEPCSQIENPVSWDMFAGGHRPRPATIAAVRSTEPAETYVEFSLATAVRTGYHSATGVRRAILAPVGSFTRGDIASQVTSAIRQFIKKLLRQMKEAGEVTFISKGRGTPWTSSTVLRPE